MGVTFVILSFEGPDRYSRAGGIATRVDELSQALVGEGIETHLFFVGDPSLPGYTVERGGKLHLYRWCQWISAHHPGGVYDGEEGKLLDWQESVPRWLETNLLPEELSRGNSVVVLAEEWQTTGSLIRLHDAIVRNGWGGKVHLLWNANNTFSFDRIDWPRLSRAATITTISRYMKHEMWDIGIDPRIVPNGISGQWLMPSDAEQVESLRSLFAGRLALLKVGRFDPNKRWLAAIDAVAQLKRLGARPLFLARGGSEGHGWEVLERAASAGLSVQRCSWQGDDTDALLRALAASRSADVVLLDGHLDCERLKLLYEGVHAVLANSGIEPFGLVGLEAMASGALAVVGSTGEDYALGGFNCVALQTSDPREIVFHVLAYADSPAAAQELRRAARASAARFTWSSVLRRVFLPLLQELGISGLPAPQVPVPLPAPAMAEDRSLPSALVSSVA